jgi:hypothetical protein
VPGVVADKKLSPAAKKMQRPSLESYINHFITLAAGSIANNQPEDAGCMEQRVLSLVECANPKQITELNECWPNKRPNGQQNRRERKRKINTQRPLPIAIE